VEVSTPLIPFSKWMKMHFCYTSILGKLGGYNKSHPTKQQLRQLAATAAERRLRDDKACAISGALLPYIFSSVSYGPRKSLVGQSIIEAKAKIGCPHQTGDNVWMCNLCLTPNAFGDNTLDHATCSFCTSPYSEFGDEIRIAVPNDGFDITAQCFPCNSKGQLSDRKYNGGVGLGLNSSSTVVIDLTSPQQNRCEVVQVTWSYFLLERYCHIS
jgi:hypothetical protein